jgi:outer membrane receptor protein involved in Fe transport
MKQLIFFLFSLYCLYPQITGTVIDTETSKPLSGVNITSGELGTASDNEGRFKLIVQPGKEVTFSHIGYSIISTHAFDGMIVKLKASILPGKEIVIRAGLKEESLQRSASSVTVIDALSIKRIDGNHFQDVMESIPNFNAAGGTSRPRYFQIRGIGERSQYFAEGPPNFSVGFVMDDIDLSGMGMAGLLYDLEQIEVFKGPQSTIFGPNALAGLISLRSKEPNQSFTANIRLTGGTDNIQRLNGMVNIPLGETLALRMALESGSGDGFRTNKFLNKTNTNGRNETIVREKLLFVPTENFNTILTFFHAKLDNKYDTWAPDNNEYLFTYTNQQGIDSQETNAFSLRTNLSRKNLNATLIVSQSETDLIHAYDGDWGNDDYWLHPPYNFDPNVTYWNYEFYDRTDRNRKNQTMEGRISYGDVILGYHTKSLEEKDNASGWLYGGDASLAQSKFNFDVSAVFAQMERNISEKIIVLANVRKETNKLKYYGTAMGFDWDVEDYVNLEPVAFEISHNLLGGKLALQYFMRNGINVYGSVSRGYKAGGVNQHPFLVAENRPYDPEFMTNFEIGLRRYTENSTLHFSAFAGKRMDQQVSISSQQTVGDPNSFIFYTANATTGSLSGFELDGTFKLNQTLSISGSLGILNTHVEAFTFESDAGITTTFGNREAAHAPKYTGILAVNYGGENGLFTRVELLGKDKFYFSDSHNEISDLYQLLNGHFGYDFGNWSIKFWGRNILNTRYATRGFYFGLEPIWNEELQDHEYPDKKYVSFGDPVYFGVTVDYNF